MYVWINVSCTDNARIFFLLTTYIVIYFTYDCNDHYVELKQWTSIYFCKRDSPRHGHLFHFPIELFAKFWPSHFPWITGPLFFRSWRVTVRFFCRAKFAHGRWTTVLLARSDFATALFLCHESHFRVALKLASHEKRKKGKTMLGNLKMRKRNGYWFYCQCNCNIAMISFFSVVNVSWHFCIRLDWMIVYRLAICFKSIIFYLFSLILLSKA